MSIRQDIRYIRERDPAARSTLEVVLLYSGVHALIGHRIAHRLYKWHLFFLARLVSQMNRFFTGVEIHPGATIGHGLFIDHGSGVVIGETTEIGDRCTIYQGATLGGTGKDHGKRHPTLGNDVTIGSGAKVLGPINIGNRARVAANAVVLSDVPDDATAVGVPGRIARVGGQKVRPVLDHTHIPDPVSQELCRLTARIDQLERELKAAKEELANREA